MILGHYALALAARPAAPRASLGATAFAAQWLDELWPLLLLAGVERVRVVPGLTAANPLDFVHYPISHSLVAALLWGAVIGGAHYAWRRHARSASVLGALVVSHWLLDLPMHRPDLPLWPGSSVRLGLGLWNSVPLTVVVELALLAGGLLVYGRATRARDRIGRWGLVGLVATLLLIFAGGLLGEPPVDARALAFSALGLWLFVPWCGWVDRHREPVTIASRAVANAPLGASRAPGARVAT